MRFTFTIDNDLTLEVFDAQTPNESGQPFLRQPHHPDGRAWTGRAEVEAWVAAFIEEQFVVYPIEPRGRSAPE